VYLHQQFNCVGIEEIGLFKHKINYIFLKMSQKLEKFIYENNHNKKFLKKHVLKYYDQNRRVTLFDFQREIAKKMAITDSGSIKVLTGANSENISHVKLKSAIVSNGMGSGKTFTVLERCNQWLKGDINERDLFDNNEHFIKCKQNKGTRCLFVVPGTGFIQWILEMLTFWGLKFVTDNVYIANLMCLQGDVLKNLEYFDYLHEDVLTKKIILMKQADLRKFLRNSGSNVVTDLFDFHFIFIDEAHELEYINLRNTCELLKNSAKFIWYISASLKDEKSLEINDCRFMHRFSGCKKKNYYPFEHSKEAKEFTNISGNFLNLQYQLNMIETSFFYKKPTIFSSFSLDNLKNTLIFDPNSSQIIIKRLNLLCTNKKFAMFNNEFDTFVKKSCFQNDNLAMCNSYEEHLALINRQLNPEMINEAIKTEFEIQIITKLDLKNVTNKNNIIEKNIIIRKLAYLRLLDFVIKTNKIVVPVDFKIDELCNLLESILNKLIPIEKEYIEYTNRIINDVCLICLDETKLNILTSCCKQKICCECLKIFVNYNRLSAKSCPLCRQNFISFDDPLLVKENEIDNENATLKNFINTYIDVIDKMSKSFKKIIVVYDSNSKDLKSCIKDWLKIKYDILDSKSSIVIAKKVSDFRESNESMILFISSAYCTSGLNLEFADAMLFLNNFLDEQEKKQMIGRANRFPRNTPLHVNYLKEY
jgi:hypothetical protein